MPSASPFLFGPTPHEEAMKFIGNKTPVTMAVFKELLPDLQARAFAISGITAADVLQEIRDSLAELPAGGDWNQIKKDVANRLHPFLADPEDPNNTKPAEARAELLLRTHGFQAYATARHAVMERQTDVFPMWQYLTMGDGHVRASHAALNGKILPANHPFWQGHYPPWEWGCRCLVVPLSEADIDAARDEDADKDITEKRILSDHPALMNLLEKEGKVWGQSQAGAIDVRSPVEREGEKPGIYRFNPGSLQLSIAGLQARYTPDVWDQFVAWAKGAKIGSQKTVFGWLSRKVDAANADPAPGTLPQSPQEVTPAQLAKTDDSPNNEKPSTAEKKMKISVTVKEPEAKKATEEKSASTPNQTPDAAPAPAPAPAPTYKPQIKLTPTQLVPDGVPVADAVRMGPRMSKDEKDIARRAYAVIGQVHGDGQLPETTITNAPGRGNDGSYEPYWNKIGFRPHHESPEFVLAHETGHWLDRRGLGLVTDYASEEAATGNDSPLKDFWRAAEKTSAHKAIKASTPQGVKDEEYKEYLLRPREIFARAYAQFIATESEHPGMNEWLKTVREGKAAGTSADSQWDAKDFAPIHAAMRHLFIKQGWMKPNPTPP